MSNPFDFNYRDAIEVGHDTLAQEQYLERIGQVATVEVSSAEILDLNSTEKELIAAPGAGKAIVIDEVVAFHDYGTATYAFSGDADIRYTDNSGDKAADSLAHVAFGEATADAYQVSKGLTVAPVANAPVVLHAASADPTTGDGTFTLYIRYRVLDLSLA